MNWDPRLTQMRAELSYNLGRVRAWCRHKHADAPPHTLVAAAKIFEALGVAMEISVAETVQPFDDAAIIETANGALSTLGYFTATTEVRWTSPGIVVFAAELSAHDRIAAVRHFHDMPLVSAISRWQHGACDAPQARVDILRRGPFQRFGLRSQGG